MSKFEKFKKIFLGIAVFLFAAVYFWIGLRPADSSAKASEKFFEVAKNEKFLDIARSLYSQGLIRSAISFELLSLLSGRSTELKAGIYKLSSAESSWQILSVLTAGPGGVRVAIPAGSSIADIDNILSQNGIINSGELLKYSEGKNLEGYLYPDTYEFLRGEPLAKIISQFTDDFNLKAASLLKTEPKNSEQEIILASLVEKEASDYNDQRLIAGILKKRLAIGMPLQVDASICYLKKISSVGAGCYPLTPLDFKINSPYNTYLYYGLPPGPIGSPDAQAIKAALNPLSSPYLYYLSDPSTGKIIYAKTLLEQNANIGIYLKKQSL